MSRSQFSDPGGHNPDPDEARSTPDLTRLEFESSWDIWRTMSAENRTSLGAFHARVIDEGGTWYSSHRLQETQQTIQEVQQLRGTIAALQSQFNDLFNRLAIVMQQNDALRAEVLTLVDLADRILKQQTPPDTFSEYRQAHDTLSALATIAPDDP